MCFSRALGRPGTQVTLPTAERELTEIVGFLLQSAQRDQVSYLTHRNANCCNKQDPVSRRDCERCKPNLAVPCYTHWVSALCMLRTCLVNAATDEAPLFKEQSRWFCMCGSTSLLRLWPLPCSCISAITGFDISFLSTARRLWCLWKRAAMRPHPPVHFPGAPARCKSASAASRGRAVTCCSWLCIGSCSLNPQLATMACRSVRSNPT